MILGRSFLLKIRGSCILFVFCIFLHGCGGGGSGNSDGAVVTGRALLGTLTDATVNVYDCKDLDNTIFTTITSTSTRPDQAGLIEIPEAILDDESIYLIKISGGKDIDADHDGAIDHSPTDNLGTLHMVATGAQLKACDFKANILTDIVYHKVSYLLLTQSPAATILEEIGLYARRLLKNDVDGNGWINGDDLLKWDPVMDRDKVTREWSFFENCIAAIHGNTSYLTELLALFRNVAGTVEMPYNTGGIAVSGNYAFVMAGESGLQVVDISNPADATIVNATDTQKCCAGAFAVSENFAYASDGGSVLQVIDVSNPAIPDIVGAVDTLSFVQDVTVSGNYAYVVATNTGSEGSDALQVIDVSDPAKPAIVGCVDTPGKSRAIAVSGDYVYYVKNDFTSSFIVIDVSNPANPTLVGSLDTPSFYVSAVAVSGNYAYVANEDSGLLVIDIHDPAKPAIVSEAKTCDLARSVALSGDYAYVAGTCYGIQVVDVSDPENPTIIGAIHTPFDARRIAVSGDYAYTVSGDFSLQITDVSHLDNPALVGAFDKWESSFLSVAVSGNYAYMAEDEEYPNVEGPHSDVKVVDVGNPANPVLVGSIDMPDSWAVAVSVSGNYAYVAYDHTGFFVIDVSDPANPIQMGAAQLPYNVNGMAVSGNYAYVVDGTRTSRYGGGIYALHVIDVSNPSDPVLAGTLAMPESWAMAVSVTGNFAYVADFIHGVRVVDISNPANPAIIGAVDLQTAWNLKVINNYLYVTGMGIHGVKIIDVEDPTNPAIVGAVDIPGSSITALAVSGDLVFASNNFGLTIVIDVSDPMNPAIVSTIESAGYASVVSDGYVYVKSELYGLAIYPAISKK